MKVLERFVRAKSGDGADCEDVVEVTAHYAAVFDGATTSARSNKRSGSTPGRLAALAAAAELRKMDAGCSASDAVALLSAAVREVSVLHPGAATAALIYAAGPREVWRVGDSPFRVGGRTFYGSKAVDRVLSDFRAVYLEAQLASGKPGDALVQSDPSEPVIRPYLEEQRALANRDDSEFGFGVIDGTPVPSTFVEVMPLPEDAAEVILASDGYPVLGATLEETERLLDRCVRTDPLGVGLPNVVRPVQPGGGYDDRAWLRIDVRCER